MSGRPIRPPSSDGFWYHQARLRWAGKAPPPDSQQLLDVIENKLASEHPDVQWAMNFCACQIGVNESEFRERCIRMGKSIGLYKDEPVRKNCTPSYIPDFISAEVEKLAT